MGGDLPGGPDGHWFVETRKQVMQQVNNFKTQVILAAEVITVH